MVEFIFWQDAKSTEVLEYSENVWMSDVKRSYADIRQGCISKGFSPVLDSALHMVIRPFFEGESKVLGETADLSNPDAMDTHRLGI